MKPYSPPKHLREDEIDRLPKPISIDTRYVKPLENAVREDLREAEKRRRSGEQK